MGDNDAQVEGTPVNGRVLYDMDSEQTMEFMVTRKVQGQNKRFRVRHVFGPLKLEPLLAYERNKDQRLEDAAADETDQTDALAVETRAAARAAVVYYDSTGTKSEGYAKAPPSKDKVYAVANMLFGMEFIPAPIADSDELCPDDDGSEALDYPARCVYDGRIIDVSATLRPATDEEFEEWSAMMARTLLVQGTQFGKKDQRVPSKAKRLIELFDTMKTAAGGYKAGHVPFHHRIAYVQRHMQGTQEMSTKNSDASPPQ